MGVNVLQDHRNFLSSLCLPISSGLAHVPVLVSIPTFCPLFKLLLAKRVALHIASRLLCFYHSRRNLPLMDSISAFVMRALNGPRLARIYFCSSLASSFP